MRDTEGVVLEYRFVETLRKMARWFAANPQRAGIDPIYRGKSQQNVQFVRITDGGVEESGSASASCSGQSASDGVSGSCDSGFYHDALRYYHGIVTIWDAKHRQWLDQGTVWVKEANERNLKVGVRYLGLQANQMCHQCETRFVFVTNGGFGKAHGSGDCGNNPGGAKGPLYDICCISGGATYIFEQDIT